MATNELNNNQENQTEEKTFTQAELNAIVQDRIARERSKYENFEELKKKALKFDEMEEANKSELQKAQEEADALRAELESRNKADEIRKIRESVSQEIGVPANLLTADTAEACKAQAEAIKAFATPAYPNVHDGGETPTPTVSKADILAIKDEKERLEAIAKNIELFE